MTCLIAMRFDSIKHNGVDRTFKKFSHFMGARPFLSSSEVLSNWCMYLFVFLPNLVNQLCLAFFSSPGSNLSSALERNLLNFSEMENKEAWSGLDFILVLVESRFSDWRYERAD